MFLRRAAAVAALAGSVLRFAGAAVLRPDRDEARAELPNGEDAAAKVERLLADIDESVKKSGSDAEFVYATLYSYDHQLEASLSDEMDKVGKDLGTLRGLQRYVQERQGRADAQRSPGPTPAAAGVSLAHVRRAVRTVSTASSGSGEFRSALESVQKLVAHAQQGTLQYNSTCGSEHCPSHDSNGSPDEIAFSTTFTEAVLRVDGDFAGKIRDSMKRKAELVEVIRDARQVQHKTLAALLDLLRGRFKVESDGGEGVAGVGPSAEDTAPMGVPAFLQTQALLLDPEIRQRSRQPKASNLQYQIEAALKKKEDTHSILLRIKELLAKTAPVNAGSVQGLMAEIGGVLRSVDAEQSGEDASKQKCESQKTHARLEEQGLRTNLALMSVVHNHTQAAIRSARTSLNRIVEKTRDLQISTAEFSNIVKKTIATLEDQSQDRRTIIKAVSKAREIVVRMPSGPAGGALLEQMLKALQEQEEGERSYRATEVAFRGAFLAYARSYLQLLRESHGHYEGSLSALELYAEEVRSDSLAQSESLVTGKELQKEGQQLCEGILKLYSRNRHRREELRRALRAVVPDMPSVLSSPWSPTVP